MTARQFDDIVTAHDPDINLVEAALVIALEEYPDLDIESYLQRLNAMASEVISRIGDDTTVERTLDELNHVLFVDEGFTGNEENYIDPRNSFINEVMNRKLGIPITLSVIYITVGRSVGLPLTGVSFPGHFLVKLSLDDGDVVIDPYAGGITLTREELLQRLTSIYDTRPDDNELMQALEATDNKAILVRLLRNLKLVYLKTGDRERALAAVDRIVRIMPGDVREIRDRGRIYQDLDCFQAALADFREYLDRQPQAWDAEDIRERALAMRKACERLH